MDFTEIKAERREKNKRAGESLRGLDGVTECYHERGADPEVACLSHRAKLIN